MFGMKYQEWGETVKPSNKGNNCCEDEREGIELCLRGDGMAQCSVKNIRVNDIQVKPGGIGEL